jgi:DNA-binding CsgD family transcriptional regulator
MQPFGQLVSPVLIGRDELLETAQRHLTDALAGRGSFLLLAGEAGIGKSRLIAAIELQATAAGFMAVDGAVAPQDHDVPAASLLDMARSMVRMPEFAELGTELLALMGTAIGAPDARRRLLVHSVVDRIATLSAKPTMLWFDDLQWTDDLSLEILSELARQARDHRILLVAAYRNDVVAAGSLLREWRSRLLTQRLAEEARLEPLNLEQTGQLADLILATGLPTPRSVVEALYERTDGVPLHIEELLAVLPPELRTDSRAIHDAAVPDTLEDAVLQRVGQLSADAQAVARAGSVIGRCFVPEVLAEMMDVGVDTLDAPLHELVESHILVPPGLRGVFDYRHQVLRDTLYSSLTNRERRRLHARAAEHGRTLEGASVIHASVHYERAGMHGPAFRSALHGAREAAALSSHREAVDLYRRALDNMPEDLPVPEGAAILEAYAIEAAAIEENELAVTAANDARSRYQGLDDALGAVRVLTVLIGTNRREARPLSERLTSIEDGLAEAEALPSGREAAQVRGAIQLELAQAALDGLDLARAAGAIAAARQAADVAADEALGLDAAAISGMIEALGGQVEDGLDRIGASALAARMQGFEDTGVSAYRNASVLAARLMDQRRAQAWIDEGLRYADGIQQSHCAHVMRSTGSLVAWAEGRWEDALRLGLQAVAERGCAQGRGMAHWPLGYVALGRGDLGEAREYLDIALEFGIRSGIPDFELAGLWGLAELALVGGRLDDAVRLSQRGLDLALASGERARFVPFVVTGVRARIGAGLPDDAIRFAQAATEHLGATSPLAAPALEQANGLLALAAGSLTSARASFERAVRGWDARDRAWEGAWVRLDLAAALLRSNRHGDASGILADARRRAQDLLSRPLLERTSGLERQARGYTSVAEPWRPLTIREFEIARLIGAGRTNLEIAAELEIAPRTVSSHVEHVLAKLDMRRRAEIATWVARVNEPARRPVPGRVPAVAAKTDLRVMEVQPAG